MTQKSLRDAKGQFIKKEKSSAPVKTEPKKPVPAPMKPVGVKPKIRAPQQEVKKEVPKVFDPEKDSITSKICLWIDNKNNYFIGTATHVMKSTGVSTNKMVATLYDPQRDVMSLKRAIKNAELNYTQLRNGIDIS
jgi:hypothetical protein